MSRKYYCGMTKKEFYGMCNIIFLTSIGIPYLIGKSFKALKKKVKQKGIELHERATVKS